MSFQNKVDFLKTVSVQSLTGCSTPNRPSGLGRSSKILTDCMIGLEFELENMPYDEVLDSTNSTFNKYWSVTNDGSLRNNGLEFVLRRPRMGAGISTALTSLEALFKRVQNKPECTQYTSTHVHLDVSQMTMYDYMKFLFVYRYFDEALTMSCGKHRYGNLYCLTFEQANAGFLKLKDVISTEGFSFRDYNMENHKYGSCNLAATNHYGSLEFRALGGCTSKNEAADWINTLCQIKRVSQELSSWEDAIQLGELPAQEFADVFGLANKAFTEYLTDEQIQSAQADIVFITAEDE